MPHKFEAHPDHPAVAYLTRLHADLGGRIQANKAEPVKLATDTQQVEAVLKMSNPDFNVAAMAPRRRQKTKPWFNRGTLFRETSGVLRKATARFFLSALKAIGCEQVALEDI